MGMAMSDREGNARKKRLIGYASIPVNTYREESKDTTTTKKKKYTDLMLCHHGAVK